MKPICVQEKLGFRSQLFHPLGLIPNIKIATLQKCPNFTCMLLNAGVLGSSI
ncbi:MAG: hypothetical protein H7296_13050 [Bacteroidia bacterium]|nr:hypothetical protein [Bacteroidia bacterium]